MRFGYCLNLQFLDGDTASRRIFDEVCDSGFDYLEFPLNGLAALSSDKIDELKKLLAAKCVPMRACNLFFPQTVTIVGPDKDSKQVKAYIDNAIAIAADLGMETAVFGSGGARKVKEGMSRDQVWQDLREVVEMMDEVAEKNDVIITIEPLNTKETNIVNSCTEGVQLSEGAKRVITMCDWYHVIMENQTLDDLFEYPDKLGHLHIAYTKERLIPSPSDDMAFYADFVNAVKKLGYDNKLSIEGGLRGTEDEIKQSAETLRKLFA